MPRHLKYTLAAIISVLLAGVPLVYGIWLRPEYAAMAHGRLGAGAAGAPESSTASPTAANDAAPVTNKVKLRRLTLNEAIATGVGNSCGDDSQLIGIVCSEPANLDDEIVNVEAAYWKLYEAYGQLYSCEELLRQVHKGWMACKNRFDAGIRDGAHLAPLLAKYHELRGSHIVALEAVQDAERNLRGIMCIRVEDGTRLVPVTSPVLVYHRPDWDAALAAALAFTEKRHPHLDAEEMLNAQERTERRLTHQYQRLAEWYERVEAASAEYQAYSAALEAYLREFDCGIAAASPNLLVIYNQLAFTLNKRFAAIAGFNQTLAMLEHVQGTLPAHRGTAVAAGLGKLSIAVTVRGFVESVSGWLWSGAADPFVRPADFVQSAVPTLPQIPQE